MSSCATRGHLAVAADDEEDTDGQCFVFHPGSYSTAVGYAGDDAPRIALPTALPADDVRGRATAPPFYDHGLVTSWDAMERFVQHCFYDELGAPPTVVQSALVSEAPWAAPSRAPGHRERWLEVLFEACDMQRVLCADQMQLGMCASGRMYGTALSVGRHVTTGAVFVEAAPQVSFVRANVGGQTVDDAFYDSMLAAADYAKHFEASTTAGRAVIQAMRRELGRVAPSSTRFAEVPASATTPRYELPDGKTIVACSHDEHRRCFEPLFCGSPPSAFGVTAVLREALVTAMQHGACGGSGRGAGSVVLFGGTTLAEGFCDRVKSDVAGFAKKGLFDSVRFPPAVVAPPERRYSEWIGGSIVASLTTAQTRFATRSVYDEEGAAGVARSMSAFL